MTGARGQATTELALILPIIAGLFGLALQGGLLVSDQVRLEHVAYDSALWAAANLSTQDDAALTAHVVAEMCDGGTLAAPGPNPTRFCTASNSPTVTVTSVGTPTSLVLPHPTGQVLGAKTCRLWSLSVVAGGGNANPAPAGSTLTYTVSITIANGSGRDPVVSLAVSNFPPNTTPGPPLFNPPAVTAGTTASTLSFTTSGATPPGSYLMDVSGGDQCGSGPSNGDQVFTVVTSGAATPTPSPCGSPPQVLQVVNAQGVSGSITTVTVLGQNFASGSSVAFGTVAAPLVTFVSATELIVTLPGSLPAGVVYNVVVTTPANCVATLNNGFTLCSTVCPTPPSNFPSPATKNPCAAGNNPNHYQTAIVITWREPLFIPWISPSVALTATQYVFCQ